MIKKKTNVGLLRSYILMSFTLTYLLTSCSGNKVDLFYYSGDQKIEFTISDDTLGFLLKDTIVNLPGDTTNPVKKVKQLFYTSLNSQGYTPAGPLSDDSVAYDRIQLTVNPVKNASIRNKEKAAQLIKKNNDQLVTHSGYLIRLKNTNQPLILTDEIIIEFNKSTNQNDINSVFQRYGLVIKRRNPFIKLQFTVAVTDNSPATALKISQQLKNNVNIRFAQINLIHIKKFHSEPPNDEYFPLQWHLLNEGTDASNSTIDADIDAVPAWEFTKGSPDIIMAVFDSGLDILQEDLVDNYSRNRLEIPWNTIDDDGNTLVDDSIGWNFISGSNNLYPISECIESGCFNFHGTAVMGLAAARQNNRKGVSGVCPECNLLPIRTDPVGTYDLDGLSFSYARSRGARIFIFCWDYNGSSAPGNIKSAINDATEAGVLVFVSMTNSNIPDCADGGLTSLSNTIAVSRSNSKDMYDFGGYGDCLDLLAPSRSGRFADLLKITTTDVMGDSGNSYFDEPSHTFIDGDCNNFVNLNYTTCFGGSSASTPIVAGAAGLVLSANPLLNTKQVQYLLQDCADKIDPSVALYSQQNGKSTSGKAGYGRLNAYEAVKIASPEIEKGGRNGVDIFFRDNELDWGNTEQPSFYSFEPERTTIPYWKSMDIKVDALADLPVPPVLDNGFFEGLPNENPVGGQLNKVYVRVRNRGFRTANAIAVKLFWVHAGAALPPLPSDFWDRFPENSIIISEWNSLGVQPIYNLEYSGASLANSDQDAAQIVSFDFTAPVHDPATRNHYCLMAIISSSDDLMPTEELKTNPQRFDMDYVTSHYNNATHRNYNIETADEPFTAEFFLYNPLSNPVYSKIQLSFKGQSIPVTFSDSSIQKSVYLGRNEKRLIKLFIDPRSLKTATEIIIQQLIQTQKKEQYKVAGGINYYVLPSSKKAIAKK